jgi:DNA-binding CsgD family transcriptional regulator/tetratricopeptide (TPR) repeat protein
MARATDLLVGRDEELDRLDRALALAGAGKPRAVFVTGEPGIGKTHVLAELVRRAEQGGCLVLEGRAAEYEEELPFGVVVDALDAYVESLGRTVVDRLAADGLGELADVFPSLHGLRAAGDRPTTAAERFRSYYAVRELLERLAARQPLVLVLDDLHWADGASTELLTYLLRRLPDAPILLAGSYRTGQAGRALVGAIEAADRAGDVERLALGPLKLDDAGQLVPGSNRATRERLYAQSGGNPFYLLQLARTSHNGDSAPPAVAAAIAQEVAALSGAARAFAEAAAVVGDPFDLDITAGAASVDEEQALASLDELLARDLVRPSQTPRRFHFRHPLVRSAVYDGSSMSTRLGAHARCAEALAARGAPATARAHHVEQSAHMGDQAAVAVLVEAAAANASRLPSSAARWFEAARRILPGDAPAGVRLGLQMDAATALTTAGRLADARALLVEGIALAGPEAGDMRVRFTAACAEVEQQLGRHEEAHARLLAALDEQTDRESEAGVALLVALATDGFYGMHYDGIVRWGKTAVAAATRLGDPTLLVAAEAVLAMGCAFTGATADAERHCDAAAALVDTMSDEELVVRRDALGHLAAAELYLERFPETARHAGRGIALARAAGQGDFFPTLFPCLGTASWVLGRLEESGQVFDDAVESARLAGNVQGIAWTLFNRSVPALLAGDWELALSTGEESVRLAESLGDSFVPAYAGLMYGWALFETGDPARGAEVMVTAAGGPDLPNIAGGWRATHLEVLARCWLALGRLDDARFAADRAREVAATVGLPRTRAMAHSAAAHVALFAGDPVVAIEEGRAAIAAFDEVSDKVDAAVVRIMLGRALAQAGDPVGAAAELSTAGAAFEAYGARRYRDQVDQELRKLGHRVSRRTAPAPAQGAGVEALSARELEVAHRVVDRRTNPEIAADLFLSLKTVETHMRNIFRKLDVSSRVEVARVVERTARM